MTRTLVLRSATVALALAACYSEGADPPTRPAAPSLDGEPKAELISAMNKAAGESLDLLPASARREAHRENSDRERKSWDFWPSRYPGARMDQVDATTRAKVEELLRQALSEDGYRRLRDVQALEPYNPWRSPYYSVMVFGEPEKSWGWRYQGHHISLNFTVGPGDSFSATPLFLGTPPLSKVGVAGGHRPLGEVEDRARELYQSFSGQQRAKADIQRPGHTYLPERIPRAKPYGASGIASGDLSPSQRDSLAALVAAYVDNVSLALRPGTPDLSSARFSWAGSDRAGQNHYYRVESDEWVVEYDSRDGGSHIHSVWRTFNGDFGEDLLAAHLAANH